MQRARIVFLGGILAGILLAHPMGNFSVNHFARIQPHDGGANILYVLDLAEIPTFELLQKWNLQPASPGPVIERRAAEQAREWVKNLRITVRGVDAPAHLESSHMTLTDGVGGMKVLRVAMNVSVKGGPGELAYDDRNYPDRAGWKEIVIGDGPDRSHALTAYPTDPAIPQPQQLRATLDLGGTAAPVIVSEAPKPQPAETAQAQSPAREPQPAPAATSSTPAEAPSLGTLKRGDYLSTVLHGGEITFGVALICLAIAFGLGAMHAFEPGHGKTMVAAYLVGSRGTPKHAILLGFMTTFTHTVSVFLLGFVTLFLSRYIMPEKMTRVLGVLSGLSIIWIGGLMLYRRSRKLLAHDHAHDHSHTHDHSHPHDHAHHHHHDHTHAHDHVHHPVPAHSHEHDHAHAHAHNHSHHEHTHEHHEHHHHHGDHDHSHDHAHHHDHSHDHGHHHDHAHPHHHMPEGDITLGSLIALGASGGMVPCPAALILLLTCISLGRPGLGILLLLSFSVGLALVLMATGLVVLYARNLIPERHRDSQSWFMRTMPVISAAIIVVVGLLMTGVSLGWLPAVRFLG